MASGQHQLQGGPRGHAGSRPPSPALPACQARARGSWAQQTDSDVPPSSGPRGTGRGAQTLEGASGVTRGGPGHPPPSTEPPCNPVSAPSACGHTAAGRGSGRCVRPRSTAGCPWRPFPRLAESHPTTSVQSPLFSALIFSMTLKACLFKGPWVALFWGWHAAIQTSCHHRGLGNAGVLTAAGVPEGVPCERQSQTRLPLF